MSTIEWEKIEPGRRLNIVVAAGPVEETRYENVVGFATGVPGLVANRQDDEDRDHFGKWTVTHVRTGLALGWYCNDPEQAIAFAHAVTHVVDWTLSGKEVQREGRLAEIWRIARRMNMESGFNPVHEPKDLA